MKKYKENKPTEDGIQLNAITGKELMVIENKICTPAKLIKEKLYYNNEMGAYGLSRTTKINKRILTPQQYVDEYNQGKFKRTPGRSYWIQQYQDSHYLVEEELTTVEDLQGCKPIPSGIFETMADSNGNLYLKDVHIKKDKYYSLSSFDRDIIDDLDFFLNNEKQYRDMKFAHRRGVLLFGPPGNGKTMAIEHICDMYKNKVRVVFINHGHLDSFIDNSFYDALKDIPIIIVLEEVVSFMPRESDVCTLLSFLDGERSWDNVFIIATTNYPEKLPPNFIDRPSRFDKLYKIDNPNEKIRELYLTKLLGKSIHKSIIEQTEGFSLAYLKELVVASKIYGRTMSEIIKEFKNRKNMIKHGFESLKQTLGFNSSEDIQQDQENRSIGFNNKETKEEEKNNV